MLKNLSFSKEILPFAPGCLFKPRAIGNVQNSDGKVFLYGGYVSLHLVLSGTGDISWRDQNRKLNPGDMFCILPDVMVRYTNTPEAPWSFCWIDVIGPAAEKIAAEAGFTAAELTRNNIPDRKLLRDKFEFIHAIAESDGNDPCVYAGLILDLVSMLRKPVLKRSHGFIAGEFEKLLQDPRNITMNVNDFAKALHIERTTLFHACKKSRHESPVRMLIRQKIAYCGKLLLAYPGFSLNKIAAMSGFTNVTYMCRAFKRETSLTPAAYREKNGSGQVS